MFTKRNVGVGFVLAPTFYYYAFVFAFFEKNIFLNINNYLETKWLQM